LHDVFGIVRTEHPRRMAIQRPLDLESKLLESAGVAVTCAFQYCVARSPGFRPHQRPFARSRFLL